MVDFHQWAIAVGTHLRTLVLGEGSHTVGLLAKKKPRPQGVGACAPLEGKKWKMGRVRDATLTTND